MKKYFYIEENQKMGPFSYEELKEKNLSRTTKVWFYGLDSWKSLSEIDELKSIAYSLLPKLNLPEPNAVKDINNLSNNISKNNSIRSSTATKKIYLLPISAIVIIVLIVIYLVFNKQQNNHLYQNIISNSYNSEVDFNFYVTKFYRDLEVFGIFPQKPRKIIIKFSKLDELKDATHIHGISLGIYDDNRIEIYINPSTWAKFNKPMRYYLMYHELSHDVLNLEDLENLPENEGKLMFPALSTYESKSMDDFIESSHELLREVSSNK